MIGSSSIAARPLGLFLGVVGMLCTHSADVWAGAKSCITGKLPTSARDATDLAAVRAVVDAACPCQDFDGTSGKGHGNFVRCARNEIFSAVGASNLRKQCKGPAIRAYAKSTCGFAAPTDPAKRKVPCIKQITSNGKIVCSIKPEDRCVDQPGRSTMVPCPAYDFCLDAADDNGNYVFSRDRTGGDDGSCPVPPGLDSHLVTGPADLIGGPLARGRFGDFILENTKIRVIIQAPQRNFSGAIAERLTSRYPLRNSTSSSKVSMSGLRRS